MSDGQNIELVLHMVNKMCGELVDKGQEYFLVTASPNKALNIGSAKGRQFLQANTDVVQRFIKHCYSSKATVREQGLGEKSKTKPVGLETTPKITQHTAKLVPLAKVQQKTPQSSTLEPSPRSLRKGEGKDGNSKKPTATQKSKSVESPSGAGSVLSAVNLTATTTKVNKPVAGTKNSAGSNTVGSRVGERGETSQGDELEQTKLKVELPDSPYVSSRPLPDSPFVSSRIEDTAESNKADETSSPTRMSLRAQRKRKIFTDCEMSPLKFVRQTFQNELKTPPVSKKASKAKGDKDQVTHLRSGKKTPTLDKDKVKGNAKTSKSDETMSSSDKKRSKSPSGHSTKSTKKSKQGALGDKSVELQNCTVKLSVLSGTTHKATKPGSSSGDCSQVSVKSEEPRPRGRRSEDQVKARNVATLPHKTQVGQTRHSGKEYTGIKEVESPRDENTESSETCVKSEAGSHDEPERVTDNEVDLNLECTVESDEDFEDNNYVDDSDDEDFNVVVRKRVSVRKSSCPSFRKSVQKAVKGKGIRGRKKGVKYKSPKVESFPCSICEKVFRGAGAMARHAIVHTKQCMECEEEFPDHESLLVHRKTCKLVKRSNKLYPCDKCDLVCIAPWSLRRHQIASHEWRCRYCKRLYDSEESLDDHLENCIDKAVKESEQQDRIDGQRQVCGTCGKQFANKGILMSHMRCHTEEVTSLISEICGVDLEQVDRIVDDIGGESKENDGLQEAEKALSPRLLRCVNCGVEFRTPKALTKHRKTCVVETKNYVCQQCDKSFKLRCELNKHARNYHPETYSMRALYRNERDLGERIWCKYCNKTSYNHAWMKVHTEGHIEKGDLLLEAKEESTEEDMETDPLTKGSELGKVRSEVTETMSEVNEPNPENPEATDTHVDRDAESEVNKESALDRSTINDAGSEVNDSVSEVGGPLFSEDGSVLLSSLRCKLCKISFKNKHELYSHAVSHRVFKCDICDKVLASAGSLKKHLQIAHSSQRDYMCELCGKAFKTPRCVQQHIGKVHANQNSHKNEEPPGPHVCPVCDKVFDSRRLLTKHKYYHKDRTTACPVCEKCFSGKGEMLYHLKHVHSDARNYECALCQKSYKTKSSLREHRAQHHMSREGWRHRCEYCDKLFNKKSQLTYHKKVHTGDKPFSCSHCELTFTQKGNLYKHLQTVHIREVQYTCELCGKGFYLNENYKLHMRTHAVENGTAANVGDKYGAISHCTICNRYFPRTCTYKAHLLMHKQEWKYSCPICKKKFVTVTSCTRHLKTHLKCNMSSLEIREKFPLKIGTSETSVMSQLISEVTTDGSQDKSGSAGTKGAHSKSVLIKKTTSKMKHTEAPKKIKLDIQKYKKVISSKKIMKSGSGNVRSVLESLATGGVVEESPDITLNLVPMLDDSPNTSGDISSINNASSIAKAVESIMNSPSTSTAVKSIVDTPSTAVESDIDAPSTSSAVESVVDTGNTSSAVESILLENVNNVMHLDDKMMVADTMTTLGDPENITINNSQEMSPSELNDILQTVNSEDFLQQLGSGNIILVQQGDTKAYVMLS